ncbi:hypothetical protein UlMin_034937 [Ulmus minor]
MEERSLKPYYSSTVKPWRHIHEIRTHKFSIGKRKANPLTNDLHHAVTNLSAELYTKDVHFLMELIQNAEDNVYKEGVEPTLEFVLTREDVTGSGAPATLFIFNNEIGFLEENINSLCSIGSSTKKGKKKLGFIGEKGIGFKSVFLVSSVPHIFSNGYRVKFSEEPDKDCGIGYIVPEWVSGKPTDSDIRAVYGSDRGLPTTTIILPLKAEKVVAVETQLAALHPEILLFLSKIKRLYVRENKCDLEEDEGIDSEKNDNDIVSNTSIVSIHGETNHVELSDEGVDSRVVTLSVIHKARNNEETCKYFIWRKTFPVKPANIVSSRKDVERWTITLAFPFGERLSRGTSSVGIFAFLPTSMVTNFPFIIQADFLLASSRESILLDNAWNLGILECVPEAFVSAFQACVQNISLFSSVGQVFEFLPAQASPFPELNRIRETIRDQLQHLKIVPCKLLSGIKIFAEPQKVIRILPKFRDLLSQIRKEGASFGSFSTSKKILHSSLDHQRYHAVLEFLGVLSVSSSDVWHWYARCIESCNLVTQASEKLYMELLCFIMDNEKNCSFKEIPLLKYTNREGNVELCTITKLKRKELNLKYAELPELHSWLSKCNLKFGCPYNIFFLPIETHKFLARHERRANLYFWLSRLARGASNLAYYYSYNLCSHVSKEPNLIIPLAHFLYHTCKQKFIDDSKIYELCAEIPIIDGSGHVRQQRKVTLVSASESKWVKLFGPGNPFVEQSYVDIGDAYVKSATFLGECTPENVVLEFISKYSKAVDLPELSPPNIELQIASSQLSSEQAFLLLDWIRLLRVKGFDIPEKFINSVRDGKWIKTYSGCNSPRQSVFLDGVGQAILIVVKHVLDDLSIVNLDFYGDKIITYQGELRYLGMGFGCDDVQRVVATRFVSLVSSEITKECAFSLLMFVGLLKQKNEIDEEWLLNIKKGKWLKTHQGYNAPEGSIFLQSMIEVDACLRITKLSVVDEEHYGSKLSCFSQELRMLGVILDEEEVYRLIAENITFPTTMPSGDSGLLILQCIRNIGATAAANLIERIRDQLWLKTTFGYKSPIETTLADSRWASMLRALEISAIDEPYYGTEIRDFVDELHAAGVAVNDSSIIELIGAQVKSLSHSSKLAPANVLLMLDSIKEQRKTSFGSFELECLLTEKWLKTRHGYKAPNESILFSKEWGSILPSVDLPLIDDGFYGINLYRFKDELQMLGVITNLEEGAEFVVKCLKSPILPDFVSADGTVSLLKCMKSVMSKSPDHALDENFLENIAKSRCLKTTSGFLVPDECILFNSAWSILKQSDVPSIDGTFYGSDISVYKDQLKVLGVKIEPLDVCSLLCMHLQKLRNTSLIKRVYGFMRMFNWRPHNLDKNISQVWIANQYKSDNGRWVNSEHCLVHDDDDLFGTHFFCLDKYYESGMLPLFSSAFGVREFPSVGDYLQLWNDWELRADHGHQVTLDECYSFWAFIITHWMPETEHILKKSLTKLSATTWVNGGIHLLNKEHVFLPDDLHLASIFESVDSVPLFAWLPKNDTGSSSVCSQKLSEIYSCLGVKKLSESVECQVESMSSAYQPKNTLPRTGVIEKGLVKMILGFLAGSSINMPAKERQEIALSLLSLELYEIDQPVVVTYFLTLSPNAPVKVETTKMVFWEKNAGQLLICKSCYKDRKINIDFGSCFAQEIAEGLLPKENKYAAPNLSKIIHLGFMYDFKQDAVDHLLRKENLEFYMEDNEFLDAYPGSGLTSGSLGKRRSQPKQLGTPTPLASSKKRSKV